MSDEFSFYLTQRVSLPWNGEAGLDVGRDFGGYELDYMGSSEFEFGEVPKAFKRLRDGGTLTRGELTFPAGTLYLLWREQDGFPGEGCTEWVNDGCHGKESAFGLAETLLGKHVRYMPERLVMWWELRRNVVMALDPVHLDRVEAMLTARRAAAA